MTKETSNNDQKPFHLLIPAAGSAARMGLETPKPYLKINGKSILRHTLEKFINFNTLESIVVIINETHRDLYDEAVQGLDNVSAVIGSDTRKQSVFNGLKSISDKNQDTLVLVHDAARPLVQTTDINKLLSAMENAEAATLASPVCDTLYRKGETVDREGLWAIQTPQAFKLNSLMMAHEKFKDDESFTDDAGLMRADGHKVEIIEGSRSNIKITTTEDLAMAETMMMNNTETRTASGYDVHAFEATPSDRKLMLGGIEIAHDVALAGHSDADVVLHAITDAVLGTINQGDIGTHFPPSDDQWKDCDSALFLEKAVEMLMKAGGALKFLDVTIMAETPKIGPHRDAIQTRIANILQISKDRVSIKATTTEKLGFVGREEGMACQALVTVTLPNA